MKSTPSLRSVDVCIAIGFALMLLPIWVSMKHGSKLTDQLSYFADILAVLAALYAGRTIFFPSAEKNPDSVAARIGNKGTMPEVVNGTKPDGNSECEQTEANPDNDSNIQEKKPGFEPHDETPQEVFYAMSAFLAAYAIIKASLFIGKKVVVPEIVLSSLLITAAFTFAGISFGRALKYKVWVTTRFVLSLVLGLGAGIIASLLLVIRA